MAVSGWEYREAAAENRRSIEVCMSVRERTAEDSRPYPVRRSREGARGHGGTGARGHGADTRTGGPEDTRAGERQR